MIDTILTSAQINLSDQAVKGIALDAVMIAQQLGLSLNSNVLEHIRQVDISDLIQQYEALNLPPFFPEDQSWG